MNFGLGFAETAEIEEEAADLVVDRDAFDASHFRAEASLTFGNSWDPSRQKKAIKISSF